MDAHIIKNENLSILFLPNSYRYFEINDLTEKIILEIDSGINMSNTIEKYNISEKLYKEIFNLVNDISEPIIKSNDNDKHLFKLVLHITNTCNLNCLYCYADGGMYNSKSGVMDKDTLLKTLDIFFDKFNTIDIIQLFGGEPTINLEAIEIVGSYIESKMNENKIKHRPILCLTTNGMCASDEFIRLVKKYEIKITVSIDGPPAITNQTRLDRKGKGVAEALERNIKKLQKYTEEPKSAEVTFTQCHIDKGITVRDTIRYINEKFGIMDVHVAPVSAPDGAAYKLLNRDSFLDMIPSIIKSRENGFMLVNRVIRNLCIKQATRQICGAGTAVYSVSATGDIYPCFMLTDINKYKLGNIHSINESFWDIAASPLKQYYTFDKFKYEQCADCFNRAICNGCMGINYYSKGDIFHTPDEECEFFKALTENVIIALVESKHN